MQSVEKRCLKTFTCVGYPNLQCNHSFYVNGYSPVDENNLPINDIDDFNDSRSLWWIALVVIGGLLLAIILIIALYFIFSKGSSNLVSLGEENEYQQMREGTFSLF